MPLVSFLCADFTLLYNFIFSNKTSANGQHFKYGCIAIFIYMLANMIRREMIIIIYYYVIPINWWPRAPLYYTIFFYRKNLMKSTKTIRMRKCAHRNKMQVASYTIDVFFVVFFFASQCVTLWMSVYRPCVGNAQKFHYFVHILVHCVYAYFVHRFCTPVYIYYMCNRKSGL